MMLSRLSDGGDWDGATAMHALIITTPAPSVPCNPAPAGSKTGRAKGSDAKALSQFFTRAHLAARYYRAFCRRFDPECFQFVEPSAGSGVFLHVLPISTFACDIAPTDPNIFVADFLTLKIYSSRPTACIGNPPFGKNSKLAIAFFNQAAKFSDVIAFILPRTFKKASTINRLDDRFHLLYEVVVPDKAFTFEGRLRSVPSVFQIWVRRDDRRAKIPEIRTHPHFTFTDGESGDFGLQRVGKDAGKVHRGMKRSRKAHYFIKGNVEHIMEQLRPVFAKAAANTAGKPSLSKPELVSIYAKHVSRRSRKKP